MNDKVADITRRRLLEPEALEAEIRAVAHAFRCLRDSKLRMRIIALLIKDNPPKGAGHMGRNQIQYVLETAMTLDELCFEDEKK